MKKHRHFLLLTLIFLMGLGTLLSQAGLDLLPLNNSHPLAEVSVLLRESESTTWSNTRKGMEQAALDYDIELRFLTLTHSNHIADQSTLLTQEISGGTDGVILAPTHPDTIDGTLTDLATSTPVVTLESTLANSIATVAADPQIVGTLLAQAVMADVKPGSTVVLVKSAPYSTGILERLETTQEVLQQAGYTTVLCSLITADNDFLPQLESLLATRYPAAIVTFEDQALSRAAGFLSQQDNPPHLYGMGASNRIAAYLEQGDITAIVAQNEFAVGYQAVATIAAAIRDEATDPLPPMEVSTLRKADMYSPESEKLLFPVTR